MKKNIYTYDIYNLYIYKYNQKKIYKKINLIQISFFQDFFF